MVWAGGSWLAPPRSPYYDATPTRMRIAFLMDPLESVHLDRDTTFALMLEAQRRGHDLWHLGVSDLNVVDDALVATARPATVRRVVGDHFSLGPVVDLPIGQVDAVFVRKDPPFDAAYLHATLLLELVRGQTSIVNDPRGLRDANEKLYALRLPALTPATLVSRERARIREFLDAHGGQGVIKPIDGAGGFSVFHLRAGDTNAHAIVDLMTLEGRQPVIVQEYLPAVRQGDKRVLLLDGEPIGAVLRVPREDEARANIHVGGRVEPAVVDAADRAIARALAPSLKADGLVFAGIDVIGGRLTEVNVTSPTGVQEIDRFAGLSGERSIEGRIIEWVEAHAPRKRARVRLLARPRSVRPGPSGGQGGRVDTGRRRR